MRKVQIVLVFLVYLLSGSSLSSVSAYESMDSEEWNFPFPNIPDSLKTPEARASYLVTRFWDNFNFTDTLRSHTREYMEENFSNFAMIMGLVGDGEDLKHGVKNFLHNASKDSIAYQMMVEIADDYLYNPDSPMLNEESYIPFLQEYLKSPYISEMKKMRYQYLLNSALKNRPGNVATDFTFELTDGTKTSLYEIETEGDLILIFYDPDCHSCHDVIFEMKNDVGINKKIEVGQISILAIYSGEKYELWRQRLYEMPENWITGYNEGDIEENELYIFREFPTIYVVDKDKNIIIKEASPISILSNFSANKELEQ